MTTFDTRISGIPCKIQVDYYDCVKPWSGSAHSCPSSDDYYGYTEFEFTVLDRKGYVADWLRKKLTDEDESRILEEYQGILDNEYED